jgi:hypothetical protein
VKLSSHQDYNRALLDLTREREAFGRNFDWGTREQLTEKQKQFHDAMLQFQLREIDLRIRWAEQQGDREKVQNLRTWREKLTTPRHLPQIPREAGTAPAPVPSTKATGGDQ